MESAKEGHINMQIQAFTVLMRQTFILILFTLLELPDCLASL